MRRYHVVAICLAGLLTLAWTGAGVAGPTVSIVQGDEAMLKDSVILPQGFVAFLPP